MAQLFFRYGAMNSGKTKGEEEPYRNAPAGSGTPGRFRCPHAPSSPCG